MVTVRLFARLKDLAGKDVLTVSLDQPVSIGQLIESLSSKLPEVAALVREKRVLVAVNQEAVGEETMVRDGDEVGIMPPFSGGSSPSLTPDPQLTSKPWTRIQKEDFSVDDEISRVKAVSSRVGGVAVFLGTARDFSRGHAVQGLRYEHYAGMTERKLAEIRSRAKEKFKVIEITIIHRTGEIPIGGNIVLIVAGAEHRSEAFRACRWCIDELKSTAPIWKKEFRKDGEIWVEGHR